MVLVSLAVLLPGARPSSRYWCWTLKADLAGQAVDRGDRQHGRVRGRIERVVDGQRGHAGRVAEGRDRERRVGGVVGVVPVDRERVAVQEADVGVRAGERGRAVLVDVRDGVQGDRGGHVLDQYRLGVAAALGVVVGHGDADGAGVAGRVVARG